MNAKRIATLCCVVPAALWLSACTVSRETKDLVARTETAVTQAQQSLGNSEAGALELQRAKDHLAAAQRYMKDGKDETAQRHASQAGLDAELAMAKAQTANVRRASEELQASIQALRTESQRGAPVAR